MLKAESCTEECLARRPQKPARAGGVSEAFQVPCRAHKPTCGNTAASLRRKISSRLRIPFRHGAAFLKEKLKNIFMDAAPTGKKPSDLSIRWLPIWSTRLPSLALTQRVSSRARDIILARSSQGSEGYPKKTQSWFPKEKQQNHR